MDGVVGSLSGLDGVESNLGAVTSQVNKVATALGGLGLVVPAPNGEVGSGGVTRRAG
ncbi:MAG TPA: hypothetical protein VFX85_13295 [Solirubrobacterales bacterium]|nr:hypothetical protein [Solirubrobacterales bacterium]